MVPRTDAQQYLREVAKETNKTLAQHSNPRKRKPKIHFRYYESSPCGNRHTYSHVENGRVTGRVVVGKKPNGKLGIVMQWTTTPEEVEING